MKDDVRGMVLLMVNRWLKGAGPGSEVPSMFVGSELTALETLNKAPFTRDEVVEMAELFEEKIQEKYAR